MNRKVKIYVFILFSHLFLFSSSVQSKLFLEAPEEIESHLGGEVTRKLGKKASFNSGFESLRRDKQRSSPNYPWILITEKGEVRFSEGLYLSNLKLLTSLSPGKWVRVRGKWAILVSPEEIEGGEKVKNVEEEIYFKPVLLAERFNLSSQPTPPLQATPVTDRASLEKAIRKEKLKAAHDPARASAARKKLAGLYRKAGQYEKAIYEYRFEMILEPDRASYYHQKIGDIYQEMGNQDQAEIEYELARLTRRESDASRYRHRLDQWEEEGKYELVLQEYRYLLQTDPRSRATYLRRIARINLRKGDREEANLYYQQLIDLYRGLIREGGERSPDFHLRLAAVYEEMGERAAALREYDLLKISGGEAAARALLKQAELFREEGEKEKAWEMYLELEKMKEVDLTSTWIKMADFLEEEGKPEEALAYWEKAAAAGGERGAKIKLKLANFFLRQGQPEKALTVFEEALPDLEIGYQARVKERIGDILCRLERRSAAGEAYRSSTELLELKQGDEPPGEALLWRLAKLEEKAGFPEKARKYYQELIVVLSDRVQEEPEKADRYYRKLAEVYQKLEQYENAVRQYQKWIEREPEAISPYYKLSRLYRDYLKDDQKAEAYREKVRELREKRSQGKN